MHMKYGDTISRYVLDACRRMCILAIFCLEDMRRGICLWKLDWTNDINKFISKKSLQIVDTSENGLLSLPPPYAWKSRGVREIKMTGNKVSKLDFSDCGRFWPKLESLYLGQNKLKEVIGNSSVLMCTV